MIKNYVLYYNAKKFEKLLYYYYEISDKKNHVNKMTIFNVAMSTYSSLIV